MVCSLNTRLYQATFGKLKGLCSLPLVCARGSHLSRDDFASVGSVATITSAYSFYPDLGVPFGAFARRRIVGAFADEMRSSD